MNSENIDLNLFDDEDDYLNNLYKLRRDYKKIGKDPQKKELVDKLLKKDNLLNMDDGDLLDEIKNRFTDKDTVKVIYSWLAHRLKYISDKAQVFRQNILSAYSYLPPNKIMKKAMKYAKHLELSPAEFDVFRKMFMIEYETPLSGTETFDEEFKNSGAMAHLLDYQPEREVRGKLNFEPSESGIIENIIKTSIANEDLFFYCVNNSFSYKSELTDYNEILIKKDLKFIDCIPPVIAALFIPKIMYLEINMIYSNIGKLIQHCYEHKKLTEVEKSLRLRIASDPTQYSDQNGKLISPIKDLQIRVLLQQSLWKLVLFLRSKQALNCDCTKFYNLISMYAPDLFVSQNVKNDYNQDSIHIITRLFHAFSLYPITYKEKINISSTIKSDKDGKEKGTQIFIERRDSNIAIMQDLSVLRDKLNENITIERDKETSFIFIRPNNNTDNRYVTTIRDNQTQMEKDIRNYKCNISSNYFNLSNEEINRVYNKEKKIITYTTVEGIIIFIVLRTKLATSMNFKNIDSSRKFKETDIFKFTSFKNLVNEYDDNPVLYDNVIKIKTLEDREKNFNLTSVVLNSVFDETHIEKGNTGTIKLKGMPFTISKITNTSSVNTKLLLYHPYNFEDNSGDTNNPFNYFNNNFDSGTSISNNTIIEYIQKYGEIFIYTDPVYDIGNKYNLKHQ